MSALEVPEEAIEKAREVAMRTGSTRASVEAAAPLIVAAALEELRSSATTQHLRYQHDDVYEKRTEMREGDFVSAEAIDELIEALRASVLRGEGDPK